MKKEPGFTTIEIIIAIAIVAVLALIVLYYVLDQVAKSKDVKMKEEMMNILSNSVDYLQSHDNYGAFCNDTETERIFNNIDSNNKYCHHTGESWAVCARLHQNSSKAWCVDYDATRKEIDDSKCKTGLSSCN